MPRFTVTIGAISRRPPLQTWAERRPVEVQFQSAKRLGGLRVLGVAPAEDGDIPFLN